MRVKLPNGKTAEFPDGMDPAQIQSVLQKQFPPTGGQQTVGTPPQTQPLSATPQRKSMSTLDRIGTTSFSDMLAAGREAGLRKGAYGEARTDDAIERAGLSMKIGNMDFSEMPRAAGAVLGAAKAYKYTKGLPMSARMLATPLGAALGGAFGQSAEDLATGKQQTVPEALKGSLEAGVNEATWEMGGQGAAKAVGKVLAPVAEKMTDKAKNIARIVKERNLPISPDAYSPSKMAKPLQWMADWVPSGRMWGWYKRKQLTKGLLAMRDEMLSELPVRVGKGEAGVIIKGGVFNAREGMSKQIESTYKAARSKADAIGGAIPMTNAREFIDNTIDTVDNPSLNKYMEKFLQKSKNGTLSYGEAEDFLSKVYKGAKADKRNPLRAKLKEAINADFLAWEKTADDGIVALRKQADEMFIERAKFMKDPGIKYLLGSPPDKVILNALETNIDSIKVLKKQLPKDSWDHLRAGFVENILNNSIIDDGLEKSFNPRTFAADMEKYGPKIKEAMPELYNNMMDFATASQASVGDFKKQNFNFGKMLVLGASGAPLAALPAKPLTIPLMAGGSWALAKSLMNPKGIMRQWLTTGYKVSPAVRGAIKQTPRAIAMEANKRNKPAGPMPLPNFKNK